MFLAWYPGIFYLFQRAPSTFVVIQFLQISGAMAGFTVQWNSDVKFLLDIFNIVNFDLSLYFFECSMPALGKSYLFNFLFVNCMPFVYIWTGSYGTRST